MKKDITEKPSSTKQESRWSQATRKGEMTESITVEKLYNTGYLVTLEKYGYASNDVKKDKYISQTRKLYSENNPLDKDESDNPFSEVFNALGKENK